MPSRGNRQLSTGMQYAAKSMFDRIAYFPGSGQVFNNKSNGSRVLSTTFLSRTGASGGSLKTAIGPLPPSGACNLILSYY